MKILGSFVKGFFPPSSSGHEANDRPEAVLERKYRGDAHTTFCGGAEQKITFNFLKVGLYQSTER